MGFSFSSFNPFSSGGSSWFGDALNIYGIGKDQGWWGGSSGGGGNNPDGTKGPRNTLGIGGGPRSAEVDMLHRYNRKDRPTLGFTELLLGRQQGLESLVSGFKNPFTDAISGSLDEATKRVRGLRGGMDTIGADLRKSALGQTQGAQVAALNAARMSSGRGGTAFGGGTGGMATRAAQQAASQQSAGLSQALLQGKQMKSGYDLQQAGMESSLAQMMMGARTKQAGLAEAQFGRQFDTQRGFMEMMTSIAGVGADRKGQDPGANLGLLGRWSF